MLCYVMLLYYIIRAGGGGGPSTGAAQLLTELLHVLLQLADDVGRSLGSRPVPGCRAAEGSSKKKT